jgi:hypothetical protein
MKIWCRFSESSVTNYSSKRPVPKENGFNLHHNGCINILSRIIKLFIHHINIIHGYTSKYQNVVVKVHQAAALDSELYLWVTL